MWIEDSLRDFATVRARTDITKGPGSREAGMAMIFKLLEAADGRWRRLNSFRLVPLVRAGARFVNGELVEKIEEKDAACSELDLQQLTVLLRRIIII